MSHAPLVSVIVPCFNEEAFIERCLATITGQDYPAEQMEILVVDGRSTDRTREIVRRLAAVDERIRLVDNPDRTKPRALNLGVQESNGDVVVRVDAHAEYARDYVSLSVRHLLNGDVDNVGGYRETRPRSETCLARALACTVSHRLGSGGAVYRTGAAEPRLVDTVFGGCYRRTVFERIGLFDERLLRGQDREFNDRLRRAGGRILFVPEIRCTYYSRSGLIDFWRWIFASGLTPFFISRIVGRRLWSWRNLAPPLLVVFLLVGAGAIFSPVVGLAWLVGVGLYLALVVVASAREGLRQRKACLVPALILAFAVTHVGYGLGSIVGLVRPLRPVQGRAGA